MSANQQGMEIQANAADMAFVIQDAPVVKREDSLDSSKDEKASYDLEKVSSNAASELGPAQVQQMVIVNDGTPFPKDPNMPEETQQVTVRALVVGSICGCIIGASNVYLGLKTGFTFGATFFGSLVGFGVLKSLSAVNGPFGGYFGEKENVVVQTTAGAAGGLSGLFVAAVPAMYQLNLLSTPSEDIGRLIALSFFTAFYGMMFAIPLRKYYILQEKLTFPSPTATAFMIRSLHSAATPETRAAAMGKVKVLGWTFLGALCWCVATSYAPGILFDWNWGWWIYTWGGRGAIYFQNFGWAFELTPAFHAVGVLAGLNASFSWLGGAILGYGILAPILVAKNLVYSPFIDPETYPGYRSNFSMTSVVVKGEIVPSRGSARYWLLWPGVFVMLCYSFAELAIQLPMYIKMTKNLVNSARFAIATRRGRDTSHIAGKISVGQEDPAPRDQQVTWKYWGPGVLVSIVFTMVLAKTEFDLNPGVALLACFLGLLFAFVGVQSSGTTDTNPIGTVAKAGQLIIGGVTKGQGLPVSTAQLTNLVGGSIVGQSAQHSVDCIGDLKTGHLLSASPLAQFWAQIVGSLVGFALMPGLFVVFNKAYPCITDQSIEECAFGLPAVAAWRAVAIAVTSPTLPITRSSGICAIVLGVVSILTVVVKRLIVPQKYHKYIVNWNAVGLAFVVPQLYYPIAMATGAVVGWYWERKSPNSFEKYAFAGCAGFIAGEGISGVVNAVLTICGVDGGTLGTTVGLPG